MKPVLLILALLSFQVFAPKADAWNRLRLRFGGYRTGVDQHVPAVKAAGPLGFRVVLAPRPIGWGVLSGVEDVVDHFTQGQLAVR